MHSVDLGILYFVVAFVGSYGYNMDKPVDCEDIRALGFNTTGIYTIFPVGTSGFKVRCDMEMDGGGWTVIQRRISDTDFYKGWDAYQVGFGDLANNFWLGNQQIAFLTAQGWYKLRVNLIHPTTNESRHAQYNVFSVGGPETNYKLYVNGYSGDAGDSLTYHSGSSFSANGKDDTGSSCVSMYRGGWWYKSCHVSNLNGDYGNSAYGKGLNWKTYAGYYVSMKETELMIKRWSS